MSPRWNSILRRAAKLRRASAGGGTEGGSRPSSRRVLLEILEERTLLTTSNPMSGFLTGPNPGAPLDIAKSYLSQHGAAFGFSPGDAGRAIVTNQYTDAGSGITHIYMTQGLDGIAVENAQISIHIGPLGQVIFAGGDFVAGLGGGPSAAAPPAPAITASQAILDAAAQLNLPTASPDLQLVSGPTGVAQSGSYSFPSIAVQDIPVHLDYVHTPQGVREAWALNIKTTSQPKFHWYDVRVDAATGRIIDLNDWVDYASDGSQLNVYALPGVSPNDGPRTILGDPSDATASPFGWFDRNGKAGPDTTVTDGANVNAYLDLKAAGTGVGPRPDGGASLNFNFPIDLTQDPSTYQDASTVNLFYLDNVVHDVLYHYGFDEASGNFQRNNYGRGGLGGDVVLAADQYGGGLGTNLDNAFMATPPDGQSPLQAMFLWDLSTPHRDGALDENVVVHELNHGTSNRLTGGPADANALNAVQSGGMGEGWSDWFSLMFSQLPTDDQTTLRPVGNYVSGLTNSGAGIRTFPYSFNMTADPRTIGGYNGNGEVHDTGEIWCSALWDLNMLLTAKYGFHPDLANGYVDDTSGGNQLAIQLVIDAMKLQPANPSFSDARNAILAADQALTGGANQYEIWTAFARRGMGYSFDDGGSSSSAVVVEAFDLPPVLFVQGIKKLTIDENASIDGTRIASFVDPVTGQAPSNYQATIDWGDGTQSLGAISVNLDGGFDVTAVSKTYAEGGVYTVTITVVNASTQTTGTNQDVIQVVDAPLIATQAKALAAVEGEQQRFVFGSFFDTNPLAEPASEFQVDVTWGDGTTGTGVAVPRDGAFNVFDVVAVNAYARFGDFTYTVNVLDAGGATATFQGAAVITDAALSAGAAPPGFNPVEGQFFSGKVAAFLDANPFGALSDLFATITWGDGRVTPGLIAHDPLTPSGFVVSGSNKYSRYGTYTTSIQIDSLGGSSLTIPGTVIVADADLTPQGTAFGLVEGQTFSGLVAQFRDANPAAPLTDFTATIDWMDGSDPEPGQIVPGGSGGFLVRGTHAFSEPGVYQIQVDIADVGGSTTRAITTANVTSAKVFASTVGLGPLTDVEGQLFSGVVATFTHGNPTKPLTDFTPTIVWGDGSTSTGSADGVVLAQLPDGTYQVSGSHVYSGFGNPTISTTIVDNSGNSSTASIPIAVSDAPIIASGFSLLTASEGTPFTATFATFTDANPEPDARDFSASIDWGDGTSSGGTIAQQLDGSFTVSGTHVFAVQPALYTVSITVRDAGGSTDTVQSQVFVQVLPLKNVVAVPVSPTPVVGQRFSAVLATFEDENPNPKPGEFSATIDWGDGDPTTVGVVLTGIGKFSVLGSHLYRNSGTYKVIVDITDGDGSQAEAVNSNFTVQAAPITTRPLNDLTITEGTEFTQPVAFFSTTNPLATADDFQAEIAWGDDGSVSRDAVIAPVGTKGTFSISGRHTFRFGQDVPISVTLLPPGAGSPPISIASTADVIDAPIKAVGFPVSLKVGSGIGFVLAQVNDGNTLPGGDLSATVAWGDGGSGPVTLVPNGVPGQFSVLAAHPYLAAGTYTATVFVNDVGGATTSVNVPVTVSAATISAQFLGFSASEKAAFARNLARFSTENTLARAGDFTATILWGDGTTSQGGIVADGAGTFNVNAAHTYATSGTLPVSVSIQGPDGVQSSASGAVLVADRIVPVTGGLDSSSDTGASSSDGVTRINQPTFSGGAEAGDIVTLTAQRPDMANPIVIGQAVASADGSWRLTTVPLVDGDYRLMVGAADAAGHISSPPSAFPNLVIDTSGPRITGVVLDPRSGKVRITVQDDRTGFLDDRLLNAANYGLSLPSRTGAGAVTIRGVSISPGGPTDSRVITLDVAIGGAKKRAAKAGRYVLSINGDNLSDAAGNGLDERFFNLQAPSSPRTSYIAQLITNGRSDAGPQVITAAHTPKPPRHVRIRRHR